ncbi:MAG: hypothetical protein ACXWLK_07175 [Rhizomicrobium sp.]
MKAREVQADARREFEAIGGSDRAARAAADRQAAFSEMTDVAEDYVSVRSAVLLLQWAVERYRREKQAPLLKRAGALFSALTGGSFTDLQVEFDEHDKMRVAIGRNSGGCAWSSRPAKRTLSPSGLGSGIDKDSQDLRAGHRPRIYETRGGPGHLDGGASGRFCLGRASLPTLPPESGTRGLDPSHRYYTCVCDRYSWRLRRLYALFWFAKTSSRPISTR